MGYLRAEEHSSVETRDTFQEGEGPLDKAVKTPSDRVKSPRLAEISNSSWLSKPPRKSYRKRVFYVSVPPPSDWVLRAKRKEAERKGLRSEKTGQRRNREYAGRELANRLCPRHCHWSGCQAVLNSIYSLKQHVRRHQSEVEPVGPAMTVSCQWKQCRMVCERSSLLLHLNRHVDKEITCIFDGTDDCDERFSRVQELSVHLNSVHANDESPPCAIPRPPDLKSPATLPRTLPSYTITTRAASRPAISAERRTRLGPWVLGTVFGHLTAGSDLNSARRARRVTRLTDKALEPMFADNGNSGAVTPNSELLGQSAEYDVLEEPSVASTHLLRDLDALEVTKHLHDGTRDVVRYAIDYSTSENDEVPTSSQMETEMEMETETETETGMDTEVEGLLLYTDVMMTSVS
ncbi:hypothetical protein B0F90DRAFT_536511 [Multifurca ochricompacta]|uniref:C2H2-type domain-containing protein n=1 Tax=Multifurca ochricompacta TaxID=376703 RepID=A0AAD4MB88_9AGAM|nr:hypothetical protein B0F90DRAFT_536511 [Multifurca ochricompacta]